MACAKGSDARRSHYHLRLCDDCWKAKDALFKESRGNVPFVVAPEIPTGVSPVG
jgi:hypothetical protein